MNSTETINIQNASQYSIYNSLKKTSWNNILLSGRWSWRTEMDSVLRATNRAFGAESAEMRRVDLEASSDEDDRFDNTTRCGEFELLNPVPGFLNWNGMGLELNDAIYQISGWSLCGFWGFDNPLAVGEKWIAGWGVGFESTRAVEVRDVTSRRRLAVTSDMWLKCARGSIWFLANTHWEFSLASFG